MSTTIPSTEDSIIKNVLSTEDSNIKMHSNEDSDTKSCLLKMAI